MLWSTNLAFVYSVNVSRSWVDAAQAIPRFLWTASWVNERKPEVYNWHSQVTWKAMVREATLDKSVRAHIHFPPKTWQLIFWTQICISPPMHTQSGWEIWMDTAHSIAGLSACADENTSSAQWIRQLLEVCMYAEKGYVRSSDWWAQQQGPPQSEY